MNNGANVNEVEVYKNAWSEINGILVDTQERVEEDIRSAKLVLEETKAEEAQSKTLLDIAIQKENAAREWLKVCIAEEAAAAAAEPYSAAWHAEATAKRIAAETAYNEAVNHRIRMEMRLQMAKECVFKADEMTETLQKKLRFSMKEVHQVSQEGMNRIGNAYGILQEVLAVDFSGPGDTSDDGDNEPQPEHVPMNPGKDPRVVFVFSCPGQEEAKEQRVCAGQTGKNLDILIGYLHSMRPDVFKYVNRYDYRITNASTEVEYKGKTGKTEAKTAAIKAVENIARLQEETQNAEYILCMGRNARIAMECVATKGKIIESRHLGFSSINRIQVESQGEMATNLRIKAIAEEIVSKL